MSSYSTDVLLHIKVLVIVFPCVCFTHLDLSEWRERAWREWEEKGKQIEGRVPLTFGNSWPLFFFLLLFLSDWLKNDASVKEWEVKKNTFF